MDCRQPCPWECKCERECCQGCEWGERAGQLGSRRKRSRFWCTLQLLLPFPWPSSPPSRPPEPRERLFKQQEIEQSGCERRSRLRRSSWGMLPPFPPHTHQALFPACLTSYPALASPELPTSSWKRATLLPSPPSLLLAQSLVERTQTSSKSLFLHSPVLSCT